jgi:hypothetical protein
MVGEADALLNRYYGGKPPPRDAVGRRNYRQYKAALRNVRNKRYWLRKKFYDVSQERRRLCAKLKSVEEQLHKSADYLSRVQALSTAQKEFKRWNNLVGKLECRRLSIFLRTSRKCESSSYPFKDFNPTFIRVLRKYFPADEMSVDVVNDAMSHLFFMVSDGFLSLHEARRMRDRYSNLMSEHSESMRAITVDSKESKALRDRIYLLGKRLYKLEMDLGSLHLELSPSNERADYYERVHGNIDMIYLDLKNVLKEKGRWIP